MYRLFLSLTMFAASSAHSQPVAEENGSTTIIVTALPPPVAVGAYGAQHIDAVELRSTAAGGLEGALARIAGFQQFRRSDSRSANPSAQGVTLRALGGNASSRTVILLDGVPVADAFFGSIPFTALPVEMLASARVTRGSGTGPFGSGALSGVIELDSIALSLRPRIAAGLAVGSRNAWQGDGALTLPLGDGHVALEAHHDQGSGFFTTPSEQRVSASVPAAYRGTSVALTAQAPLGGDTSMTARLSLFQDDRSLRFAGADSHTEGIDANIRFINTGRWEWQALGWVQARDFSNIVISATSFRPTLNQRATPTNGWGAKWEIRPPIGASRTQRFGFDVRGADGVAVEDALAPSGGRTLTRRGGGNVFTIGAFAETGVRLGSLSATAGARIDHWRLGDGRAQEQRTDGILINNNVFPTRHGTIASLRGALAYAVDPRLMLRTSAYTGFRLPTLNELYRGFTVFPVVTLANAALDPERLRGWEAGLEWHPDTAISLMLTAFDNRLDNAIANVTIGPNLRERRNVDAIVSRGVEAIFAVRHGPWRVDAAWAYSNARVHGGASLKGLRPAQSPAHSGGVTLGWSHGTTLAQLGLRHIGTAFEDDRNVDRLPAATTIDALFRHAIIDGLMIELTAENLSGERIVTRNTGGSIDLATPRTFWMGLRWALE